MFYGIQTYKTVALNLSKLCVRSGRDKTHKFVKDLYIWPDRLFYNNFIN